MYNTSDSYKADSYHPANLSKIKHLKDNDVTLKIDNLLKHGSIETEPGCADKDALPRDKESGRRYNK